jgi:hypothetical protein
MVELLLKRAAARLSPWVLTNLAAVFLKQNDCKTADRLTTALGKTALTEKRAAHLMEYAILSGTAEPVRHLIEDLHFDPNMTVNNPGQGPLYAAVVSGTVPVARYLLTKTNADPNLGLPRYSALDMAETAEHFQKPYGAELVRLLKQHTDRSGAKNDLG